MCGHAHINEQWSQGGVTAVEQNTAAGSIPTPHISEDLFQVAEINGINHDWSAGGQ